MSTNYSENKWTIFFEKILWIKKYTKTKPSSVFLSIANHFGNIRGLSHTNLETKFTDYNKNLIPSKVKFGVNHEVDVEDLINYLNQKYPKSITKQISFNPNSKYYIYYYQSLQGDFKKAILIFNTKVLENNIREWNEGMIYYPSGDGYVTLKLDRVFPGEGEKANPEFIYFKLTSDVDEYKHQINFFTIKLSNKPIEKRYQLVISTSSLTFDSSDNNKKPVLLFCIIREVKFTEIDTHLNKEIDQWIIEKFNNMRLMLPPKGTLFTTKERFLEFISKKETSSEA